MQTVKSFNSQGELTAFLRGAIMGTADLSSPKTGLNGLTVKVLGVVTTFSDPHNAGLSAQQIVDQINNALVKGSQPKAAFLGIQEVVLPVPGSRTVLGLDTGGTTMVVLDAVGTALTPLGLPGGGVTQALIVAANIKQTYFDPSSKRHVAVITA
jgi:hypothetical protein